MSKLDAGCRFLTEQKKTALNSLVHEAAFEINSQSGVEPTASVFVEFDGDLSALEAAGLVVSTVAGDVANGTVELRQLERLAAVEQVVRVEVARAMHRDLDLALPEIGANAVHTGPPGHRGNGVIVGIIDSGIDYLHEAFRRPDLTSRILAIWDQGLVPQGAEASPAGFTYGVEYDKAAIDAALLAPNPLTLVRHQDPQLHGTHVSGIAAGDGSAASLNHPAFTFIGIAPEADIVVVANTRGSAAGQRGLGDSADTLDAARYIYDLGAALGRPVVINQSQGDNVGPHDGTSLLERGLDNLLGGAGRAMVKSAGNEGSRNRHASGTVVAGGAQPLQLTVPARIAPVIVDIWYDGPDRLNLTVTPPGGVATAAVAPGTTTTLNLPGGNTVSVDSDINDPGNGDNRIFAVLGRGTAGTTQPGTWTFTLTGVTVSNGQWDAWIQRGDPSPEFLPPLRNPARTISIPGTANEIITAASYVTRGSGVGSISTFSSLGPTRDGRQAPTVAAPGQAIIAPQPASTGDTYGSMSGTSMAAPMVTGTVALMLQRNPNLTAAEIRDCLMRTARSDASTGVTPNNAWGAGKLDTKAAFACPGIVPLTLLPPCRPTLQPPCVPTLRPPCFLTVRPPCQPTLQPPCRPTLQPPCVPTLRPPCFPTVRPPCRTQSPPCPQPTLEPPCPQPTLEPPCPQPTLEPPCPQPTLEPPCPQPTDRPPCPQPTLQPPCPQPTLEPPCPQPSLRPPCFRSRPEDTSGGWAAAAPGWDERSWAYQSPEDPYASWLASDEPWSAGWDQLGAEYGTGGTEPTGAGNRAGANATDLWYGNDGY
jgi:subtilisin family serine protease